jgi:hypothetical protein
MGDGVAHLDFYPPPQRDLIRSVVETEGDGWRLPFPGLEQLAQQIRDALASDDPDMFAAYSGPGWEFDEIHTGHGPMLSTPGQLATVLDRYST